MKVYSVGNINYMIKKQTKIILGGARNPLDMKNLKKHDMKKKKNYYYTNNKI